MENINNSKLPQFPKKLPGSFWGITAVFNPQGYKNKIENYNIFREASKKQGLKLITVECAFGNQPFFLLPKDADILIQVRSNSILWQKERLLNIAYENLPKDCDKIAWLDSDILFLDNNWIKDTSDLLEKYIVVQPFKYSLRISKKDSNFIKNNINNKEQINFNKINKNNKKRLAINEGLDLSRFKEGGDGVIFDSSNNTVIYKNGYPGFAWAARKEIFSDIGFYDKMIIGGADKLMQCAFIEDQKTNSIEKESISDKLNKDIDIWSKKIYKNVKSSSSFINGKIIHLYHGSVKNRAYLDRYLLLKKYDFDPNTDIKLNEYKCFEWSSNKEDLHNSLKKYFNSRNENGLISIDIFYFFKSKNERSLYFNHIIGKIGIKINKISPNLYLYLKNLLKNNIRIK